MPHSFPHRRSSDLLCEDVAEAATAAATPRAALRNWTGRLHIWQAFMAKHGSGGLSEAAVTGLIGELIFLRDELRSEEHTSELQSLMRHSYAVFCWKKKTKQKIT